MYILSRKNSENQQVYVHNDVHFASDLLRTSSSFHIFSHLFTFHLRWGTLEIAFTTLALQCSSAGSNGPSFDSNFSWRGQRHVRHVWGSSTDLLDWEGRVQQMTSFAFSMILILILHVRTVLYRNVQCGFLQVKTLDHDPLSLKLFFNLRHIYYWSLSKCLEFCLFESLGFLLDFFATAGNYSTVCLAHSLDDSTIFLRLTCLTCLTCLTHSCHIYPSLAASPAPPRTIQTKAAARATESEGSTMTRHWSKVSLHRRLRESGFTEIHLILDHWGPNPDRAILERTDRSICQSNPDVTKVTWDHMRSLSRNERQKEETRFQKK